MSSYEELTVLPGLMFIWGKMRLSVHVWTDDRRLHVALNKMAAHPTWDQRSR